MLCRQDGRKERRHTRRRRRGRRFFLFCFVSWKSPRSLFKVEAPEVLPDFFCRLLRSTSTSPPPQLLLFLLHIIFLRLQRRKKRTTRKREAQVSGSDIRSPRGVVPRRSFTVYHLLLSPLSFHLGREETIALLPRCLRILTIQHVLLLGRRKSILLRFAGTLLFLPDHCRFGKKRPDLLKRRGGRKN